VDEALVQAGRHAGATVVAVAGGTRKLGLAQQLGASVTVDYGAGNWPDEVRAALGERRVTTVFDGVGGAVGRAAIGLLGAGGRFVVYGWSSGAPTDVDDLDASRRGIAVLRLQRPTDLRPLEDRALAAAGQLAPVIGQRFALRDAAEAHRAIEARATTGKTVLRP
jgi:NADPH2:quinone reductase